MNVSRLCCAVYAAIITFFLILLTSSSGGEFIPPRTEITTIAQKSSLKVSQFCGDALQCRSLINQAKCLQINVCKEIQTCNGRTDFPAAESPLQDWSIDNVSGACAVSEEKPNDLPSGFMFQSNTRILNVNGSGSSSSDSDSSCQVKRSNATGDVFSVTFWIKADCENCSVVDLTQNSQKSVQVRVVDADHVCVGSECTSNDHLSNAKWAFVAIMVNKGLITLYLDGNQVMEFHQPDVDGVVLGTTEMASKHTMFNILHAQFFQDVLTPREIKEMDTGLVDPTAGSCRCTPGHPNISSSQDSLCVNSKGESYPRYNSRVEFNSPDVILDASSNNWASAEQGPVTLMFNFKLSYQIESIKIYFLEPPPSQVTYRLISNGQEKDELKFDCSQSDCNIALGTLDKTTTLEKFDNKTADGVKIVLHRDHEDDVSSFIISRITIIGRCDCHGNAGSCVVNGDSYSCECEASTNTKGPHCRSCQPNFFRQTQNFDCQNQCQCFRDGVEDENNQCDENGGKCICKEHVEGFLCNACKPWTYKLDGTTGKGCTACPCFQSGSESCSNVTGVCQCKKNVALPNCQTCKENHYGFGQNHECEPCNCLSSGTVNQNLKCSDIDGKCQCKARVEGRMCHQCKSGYYDLQVANNEGCRSCDCNPGSIENATCNQVTGQCACRGGDITDLFCTPEIMSIEPTFGPLVGGTDIVIKGKLLGNYTRSASICLGNVKQPIIQVNDSVIYVKTIQGTVLGAADLKVECVGMENTLTPPLSFSYRSSPVLDASKTVKGSSFVSGGCIVRIYGSHLNSVKYPRLDVRKKNEPNKTTSAVCYHRSGNVVCGTPDFRSIYTSENDKFEMAAVFDGITIQLGDVDVKPDPVMKDVGNIEFQYPFEDTIKLSGSGFLSACETSKYTVHIGLRQCTITHISDTTIECEPPVLKARDTDKVPISIAVGSIDHKVGTLEYLELHETTGFIAIVSSIIAVIIIIIIIFIIRRVIIYRRNHPKLPKVPKMANTYPNERQRQMNTYTELSNVAPDRNGQNGVIRVESVVREPKKGIVNTEAETNILRDEFLPHVEPGIRTEVTGCFIGGGSFGFGTTCFLTGQKSQVVDGTLQRNGRVIQKLLVKSFRGNIKDNLQPPGDENSLLVSWAQHVLRECLRFRKQKHNHILHTIGIGITQQKIHILYEHMSRGTLKKLVSDTEQDYSVRKLLGFSQQVAEGIAFLASKDITHKDVASRNCMVDEYSVVKLGDAGFAWDFYPNEYVYNEQRVRYLPLRWMAPESIDHGYYDMRTDVWSFGIMIWELLTRGCLPFHEVQDADVNDYISNGYILGKPEFISDDLYDLLRSCWSPENETRPTIASVSSALCNLLEADDESTYANLGSQRKPRNTEAQFYSSTNISGV